MAATKIVVIGAGSVIFCLRVLQDLIYHREVLEGSTLVLVDIDEAMLERVAQVAKEMNAHAQAGYVVQHTTDRTEALRDAEYVVIAAEMDRDRLWQLDWQIPLRHGIRHVLGENAGPGGLSHALRTVPLVLDICRDVERLCPHAWVLNLTNPMSRVCLAVARHTSLKLVGLCHQIGEGYYIAAHLLGMVDRAGAWPDDLRKQGEAKRWIDIKAAGINHFTWILDIRERATGRDLYPRLRAEAQRALPDFHPLTRHLFEVYGLMPTGGDMHVGELIGYASEFVGLDGPDFGLLARRRMDFDRLLGGAVQGQADLSEWLSGHSNERVVDFIAALRGGGNGYELAANIPNRGCIPNLPEDAIVEVPAVVSGDGVYGLHVGPLPDGIAALCAQQIAVQELAVEASVTGDRQKALQALLLDPTVPGFAAASAVLADLLAAHAAHLPQFAN